MAERGPAPLRVPPRVEMKRTEKPRRGPYAVRSHPSDNRPPCEAAMPVLIRPYRRFPVYCAVTYNAGRFLKLPLAYLVSFGSCGVSGYSPTLQRF
jgi:hypothetical protein